MLKAKREKIVNKYSKHLYIYDTIREGTDHDRKLETPVLGSDIDDNNMDNTYDLDISGKDAYIIKKDGTKIYSGYDSRYVQRFFQIFKGE